MTRTPNKNTDESGNVKYLRSLKFISPALRESAIRTQKLIEATPDLEPKTTDPFPGTHGKKLRTAEEIIAFLKLWKRGFYYQEAKNQVQEIINYIEKQRPKEPASEVAYRKALKRFVDKEPCAPVDEVINNPECQKIAKRFKTAPAQVSLDINRLYIESYRQ